jgi:ABC-type nitrate/sulfonate/bicarbonate transport system substrate-binding protein
VIDIRHVLTSALLISSLVACGSAAGTAGGAEVTELRYQGNVGSVTLAELAENLGYLGNVKLKWIGNTISGPQDIQSAATGQTDFGGAFNGAIAKLVAAKAPIKAVVSYYGSNAETGAAFWVAADSPIKGPRDLIGKKVGVNTLGAHYEAVLKEWLKRAGLTPEEIRQVELVVVPPVNTEQSLRAGQLDVGTLSGVLRDKALERGGIRKLFQDTDLLGDFNAGSYVMRTDFIQDNPATAKAFVSGVAKAIEWTKSHTNDEVIAKLKDIVAKRGRNEDSSTLDYFKGYGVSSKGGVIEPVEFQRWIDGLAREGELQQGQISAAQIYTNDLNDFASVS